jgi:hypothetical protein
MEAFASLIRCLVLTACVCLSVCVVQEVKTGDAARVRNLLSRVTSLTLPPKKMKGFFRWGDGQGAADPQGAYCHTSPVVSNKVS